MDIHEQAEAWIIHDGQTIMDVNAAFCRLFRCEREQVIDSSLFDLISDPDLRALGRVRMTILRETDKQLPDVLYDFRRFDGSIFWGVAHTSCKDCDEHPYESVIKFIHNVRE